MNGHVPRLVSLVLSERARPLRFVVTGGVAAVVQLTLLALLTYEGMHALPANVVAFVIAAQVNFLLSQAFTWHDRSEGGLARRWVVFHSSIAAAALINLAVFALAHRVMPSLIAAALGILVASIVNFAAHDRLTFRAPRHEPGSMIDEV